MRELIEDTSSAVQKIHRTSFGIGILIMSCGRIGGMDAPQAGTSKSISQQLALQISVWFSPKQKWIFGFGGQAFGTLYLTDDKLQLVSESGATVLDYSVNDIISVKAVASGVTFKFGNGKRFSMNVSLNRNKLLPLPGVRGATSIPWQSAYDFTPFLDYFRTTNRIKVWPNK